MTFWTVSLVVQGLHLFECSLYVVKTFFFYMKIHLKMLTPAFTKNIICNHEVDLHVFYSLADASVEKLSYSTPKDMKGANFFFSLNLWTPNHLSGVKR